MFSYSKTMMDHKVNAIQNLILVKPNVCFDDINYYFGTKKNIYLCETACVTPKQHLTVVLNLTLNN